MNESAEPQKPEGIRAWYERTTKRIRKAIFWSSVWALLGSVVFYFAVSEGVTHRLQIFNGAIVIPVAAAIWIAAFIWMFLLPSREAGFRSQEAIERAIALLSDAIDRRVTPAMSAVERVAGKIEEAIDRGAISKAEAVIHQRVVPAADAWNRLGQRLEGAVVNDKVLLDVKVAAQALAGACRKLEQSQAQSADVAKFIDEARPVVRMLENVKSRAERELGGDFVADLKSALASVRELGAMGMVSPLPPTPPAAPAASSQVPKVTPKRTAARPAPAESDIDRTLSVISRRKVSV